MIAALPMYDLAPVRAATDTLWFGLAVELRQRGIDAPHQLARDSSLNEIWCSPNLLLAQTCGYPFATSLRDRVSLVGVPAYAVRGCSGSRYRSVILVREDDPSTDISSLRGRRAAYNDRSSQSGYSAFRATIAPFADGSSFFRSQADTGSHIGSMRAVAARTADVCSVDCVSWALAERYLPELASLLRVVAESPDAPGLPFICARGTPAETISALRESIVTVLEAPEMRETCEALFLSGIHRLDPADYDCILRIEEQACALGYPELV